MYSILVLAAMPGVIPAVFINEPVPSKENLLNERVA